MAEEVERIAILEAKMSEVTLLSVKLDKVVDGVAHINLALVNLKQEFVSKADFKETAVKQDKQLKEICTDYDLQFEKAKTGQKRFIQATISATVALVVFLFQQLFNIHIKVDQLIKVKILFD